MTNDVPAERPQSYSIYPLDKYRTMIREEVDNEGYTHKFFELKDPSGRTDDTIEVEYVTNIPQYEHEAAEQNKVFVSEEVEASGYTRQVVFYEVYS